MYLIFVEIKFTLLLNFKHVSNINEGTRNYCPEKIVYVYLPIAVTCRQVVLSPCVRLRSKQALLT